MTRSNPPAGYAYLTEAAAEHGLHPATLYRHARRGRLTIYHRAGRALVRLDELERLMEPVASQGATAD